MTTGRGCLGLRRRLTRRFGLPGAPSVRSLAGRSPVPRGAGDSVGGRPYGSPVSTQSPGFRGSTSAGGRVEGVRQCVAARCPLGSGRRATARRSPAERETAWVAVHTVRRLLGNPPVSGGSTSAAGRVEGDPPVRSAKRPPRLGLQGDRSPVPRRAGDSVGGRPYGWQASTQSPGFRGIDERCRPSRGGPAVCGDQVPPRLGSQGDRSPVPRGAGDSVCMAVPGLRRRPPSGPEPRSPIGRRSTSG